MATRFDSTSFVPGVVLFGVGTFGLPGVRIPKKGFADKRMIRGPDDSREIAGRITRFPTTGRLVADETTLFTLVGAPVGKYTAEYQLYVDGVPRGSPVTMTFAVGSESGGAAKAKTLPNWARQSRGGGEVLPDIDAEQMEIAVTLLALGLFNG